MKRKKLYLSFLILSSCLFFFNCTPKLQSGTTIPSGDTIKIVKNGDRYFAEIPIEVNRAKIIHKVLLKESRIDTPTFWIFSRIDTQGSPKTNLKSNRIDTPTAPPKLYKYSQSRIDTPALLNFVVEQDCTMTK